MIPKRISWKSIDDKINSMKDSVMKKAIKIRKQVKEGTFFKWVPLSKKQKQVFTWWMDDSPVKDADGIIADGAIRSGKSICMSTSFVFWAMETFEYKSFAIAGKTIGSLRRNVVFWLKLILKLRGYNVHDSRTENVLTITKAGNTNFFYLFGGKDERSQDLIQGITLAGLLLDEVAIMPESFVNQATGRCSVDGSKMWFNCNPQGPFHYFKVNWIDKRKEKNLLYLHFTMDDNLSLSDKIKERYRRMYSGVFFKRYILGLWVIAQGIIYDMFDEEKHVVETKARDYIEYYVSCDYGTFNALSFGLWGKYNGVWYKHKEFYYDGRKLGKQKTDAEYYEDLKELVADTKIKGVIIDPSASSFITLVDQKAEFSVIKAKNEVLEGIRNLGTALLEGMIKYNDCCVNSIREFYSYMWDEKAAERGEDKPLKQFDHAKDEERYFVNTIIFNKNKLRTMSKSSLGI